MSCNIYFDSFYLTDKWIFENVCGENGCILGFPKNIPKRSLGGKHWKTLEGEKNCSPWHQFHWWTVWHKYQCTCPSWQDKSLNNDAPNSTGSQSFWFWRGHFGRIPPIDATFGWPCLPWQDALKSLTNHCVEINRKSANLVWRGNFRGISGFRSWKNNCPCNRFRQQTQNWVNMSIITGHTTSLLDLFLKFNRKSVICVLLCARVWNDNSFQWIHLK